MTHERKSSPGAECLKCGRPVAAPDTRPRPRCRKGGTCLPEYDDIRDARLKRNRHVR